MNYFLFETIDMILAKREGRTESRRKFVVRFKYVDSHITINPCFCEGGIRVILLTETR